MTHSDLDQVTIDFNALQCHNLYYGAFQNLGVVQFMEEIINGNFLPFYKFLHNSLDIFGKLMIQLI